MGIMNDIITRDKLSLNKFNEILNDLLKNPQNKNILQEIGLLKEFFQVITDKEPDLLIYYSKNHKIVKSIKYLVIMRQNFLEWTKYLFDIDFTNSNSIGDLEQKIKEIKTKNLTKEYFINNIKKNFISNKNFKKLIYYGFPPNLRMFIWEVIINVKYNNNKNFVFDIELEEYKKLILNNKKQNAQIEKDINRTFIKDEERMANNIKILKNILICIDNYNKSGYCQGMNFIVGFLLKITNYNEVRTFYIFKHILNDIKGYFEEGFPLLNKNVILFQNYFQNIYQKIHKHFKKHEIINEFYITKWLQTLLTLSLPFEELSIIWDILLLHGFDFIVFICLAFFDFIENDIIKLKESADIINYLEKLLNPEGETLFPMNIKFFEQIDEYIIPINEILEKAYELEKKYSNKNNIINNKKISDNQLLNLKFNNNIVSNNIDVKKFPSIKNGNNQIKNDNNNIIESFQNKKFNSLNTNINTRPNYNSMKNLVTYNFSLSQDINFRNQKRSTNNLLRKVLTISLMIRSDRSHSRLILCPAVTGPIRFRAIIRPGLTRILNGKQITGNANCLIPASEIR